MKKIAQFIFVPILILGASYLTSCEKKGSGLPVDGDGNEYHPVIIGTQTWLNENLKTTKYCGGAPISLVTDNKNWEDCKVAAYCWYNNDEGLKDIFGALYNYYTVKIGVLCPIGYHIPTNEDWMTLINYLGGEAAAGDKLKEIGFAHWESYNYGTSSTNESGFTALPGGRRYWFGEFHELHRMGSWWISDSRMISLVCWNSKVDFGGLGGAGLSVRCVKNE